MADRALPFDRGDTWYGTANTIDTSNYGTSIALEGLDFWVPDMDSTNRLVRRSESQVHLRVVRNVSGITLIPGLAMSWKSGSEGKRVDGYTDGTAERAAGIVDEFYSDTAGVRNGDLFYLVTAGNVLVHTPVAGSSFGDSDWVAGDILYAISADGSLASTTGASTANEAGRLQKYNTAGTATSTSTTDGTLVSFLANRIARALSGATTHETGGATKKLITVYETWPGT